MADLCVAVDPLTATTGTVRTFRAALADDWLDVIGDEISAPA